MEDEAKASNPNVEGLCFQIILDDQMRLQGTAMGISRLKRYS
jgi:hypothetical protein